MIESAYFEREAVNMTKSYSFESLHKNMSTPGRLSTYMLLTFPVSLFSTVAMKSAFCFLKSEWMRVSSKSRTKVFHFGTDLSIGGSNAGPSYFGSCLIIFHS